MSSFVRHEKIKLLYGFISSLTLLFGICIYIIFRDLNHLIVFKWIPELEFTKLIIIELKTSIFSNILKYNFPDMLWFVSGILLLRFIWFYRKKEQNIYVLSFYVTGMVFETNQLSDSVPGNFDFLDLLFMGIGAFVEGFLYNKFMLRRFV